MPSTADLVKAAQAGDTAAFAELVVRYEKVAVITAHAILQDFHTSQDAAQDAFVLAYKRLSQIRDASSFGPWLLQIVRRGCLRLQKTKTAELISPEVIEGVADTETDSPPTTSKDLSFDRHATHCPWRNGACGSPDNRVFPFCCHVHRTG